MKRFLSVLGVGSFVSLVVFGLMSAAPAWVASVPRWLNGWPGFAYDPQHSAQSPIASQPLLQIHWQTPIDMQAPSYGPHFASPLITPKNNVIVTVKQQASGAFRIDCRKGADGTLVYSFNTDYVWPPWSGIAPCGSTLTPRLSLATPAIGGTVLLRASADSATSSTVRQAFYGIANYNAASSTYASSVMIDTPITSDGRGNLFFGFVVTGATPIGLQSGIARLDRNGNGIWISAASAAADSSMTQVPMNCAPAISRDGQVVYVAVRGAGSSGYLVGLNSWTLAPLYRHGLRDPRTGNTALVADYGTASPTIGPDGDVFYGVLENPIPSNNDRGWLLHFDATLTAVLTPGAFGWDTTAAVVPSSAVPQYTGSSPYLLLTKYSNYAGFGTGDGLNRVAILDPHAAQIDPISGVTTMREVITILGPTPDPSNQNPNTPNAVKEWCINSVAVDVASKSALVNNDDGNLYRWDFATNSFTESVTLTGGSGESYTPTCIGRDGTVYAISNPILFAVGQ